MKNNNHLLKPNTTYAIWTDRDCIIIDGKKYHYDMDVSNLNLDKDGDCIKTSNDAEVKYVYRMTTVTDTTNVALTEINVLGEMKEYDHLLKDGKTYVINSDCIVIGKTKYRYSLSNRSLLGLDLIHSDIVKVKRDGDIFNVSNCNNDGNTHTGVIHILGKYFVMSQLDKTRLDIINGKDKSTKIKQLLQDKISKILLKIQNSKPYKNGKLTQEFININPEMVYPEIESIDLNDGLFKQSDILYFTTHEKVLHPIGMFELRLYRTINAFIFKAFSFISQNMLSTKHMIGTPPEWEGDSIIKLLEKYEDLYKEIKSLYKITGLLTKLRKESK